MPIGFTLTQRERLKTLVLVGIFLLIVLVAALMTVLAIGNRAVGILPPVTMSPGSGPGPTLNVTLVAATSPTMGAPYISAPVDGASTGFG
jgi:hypothetical protein